MAQTELRFDLPAEVASLLGDTQAAASLTAKQSVVVELVRAGRMSQGKAAEALGITRHALIDLLAQHDVPSGPATLDEYREDVETAGRHLRDSSPQH